jgi:DNA repair exonuclease SbcCD nuclease subunit
MVVASRYATLLKNLVSSYADPVRDYFNIGVLHTALEGYVEHPNYAPCTLEELHAKGYDYWALGHVHEHKRWTGRSTIVFPGNLQGRSIRETGRRGAVMVTVEGDRPPQVERLFMDVLRWEAVAVDVSACESLSAVGVAASRELSNLLETDAHVPRAVRVTFTGETSLHGDLFGREQELRAHVLAEIAVIGHDKLWLEKVKLTTRPRAAVTVAAAAGVLDGLPTDGIDAFEAAQTLFARLQRAREAKKERDRLKGELNVSRAAVATAQASLDATQAGLRTLYELGQTEELPTLQGLIAASDRYRECAEDVRVHRQALMDSGDGLTLEALLAEWVFRIIVTADSGRT